MTLNTPPATVRRRAQITSGGGGLAQVVGAILMALALLTASGEFDSLLAPWFLVVVAAVCTVGVRTRSVIAFWHLAQVTLLFALTGALFGTGTPKALGVLLTWVLAMTGVLLLLRRQAPSAIETSARPMPLNWWHITAGAGIIVAQLWFYRTNVGGIGAQFEGGVTGGSGVSAIVLALAPLWALMLGVALIGNRSARIAISILLVAEALALSQSGFRGASVNFVLSGLILANLLLPRSSTWRSWRAVPAIIGLLAVAFVGFNAGAAVKSQTAASHGLGSGGTSSANLENLGILTKRLDLMAPLAAGVEAASNPGVSEALSWKNSLLSIVPRALYPDKPEFRYGQTVSVVVYGASPLTSSTITFLGDIYCNFGPVGTFLLACAAGVGAWWSERAKDGARGTLGRGAAVVGVASVTSLESQLPLALAGALRGYLFLCAGWLLLEIARPRSRRALGAELKSIRGR